jgi:hypothetical protein
MSQPGYTFKYDFLVDGTLVRVFREGKLLDDVEFSTTDKDTREYVSYLNRFLQSIGRSRVDAHAVCQVIERGEPVGGVFGNR